MAKESQLPGADRNDKDAGYEDGRGPKWVSRALGVPGCLKNVRQYLSEESDESSLVLQFGNGYNLVVRPARKIGTRWLAETLSGRGFPIKYYSARDLAEIGQAIGRIADRNAESMRAEEVESTVAEYKGLVAAWLADCLRMNTTYVLRGRKGSIVRAAIEHVRKSHVTGSWSVALIYEPERDSFLVWTVPLRSAVRDRMGSQSDAAVSLNMQRAELRRERLAARPVVGQSTIEIPCWVVPNGWQGVAVEIPDDHRGSGALSLPPLGSVGHLLSRGRARAHAKGRTLYNGPGMRP